MKYSTGPSTDEFSGTFYAYGILNINLNGEKSSYKIILIEVSFHWSTSILTDDNTIFNFAR